MLVLSLLLAVLGELFGARSAPTRFLRALEPRVQDALARMIARRGSRPLIYEGEDAETVRARLERMAWIARDPLKAVRHLSRLYRRVLPLRMAGQACPPGFAPPCVPIPALADGAAALIAAPEP